MSYKFTKEELEQLLVDYNKIALKEVDLLPSVDIWDETLRDGEQSPTVYLTLDEKIHLAKLMDEIGVKIIAVGYPAVSESEKKIVKTIVNESQAAGSYTVVWDEQNYNSQFVDEGIYGCVLEADNFECFGDIQIDSISEHVIVYSAYNGTVVNVAYKSSLPLGGINLIFIAQGSTDDPTYEAITNEFIRISSRSNDTFHVSILPDVMDPPPLPTLPSGYNNLLSIPVDDLLSLDSVDASDGSGTVVVPPTIVNQ